MDSICQTTCSLSHCSKLIVYDILLLHPVSCHNDFHSAQCDLDCIVSNIMSIHLVINPKYMLFSSCPNSLPSYPTLTISGTPIEQVQSFCYLGLLFTPKLSWSDHIRAIAQKACRLVVLLYRQFYKSCSSPTLLSLYFSIIWPVLEYSSVVWDPSSATHSSTLESVQYFALKVISKLWSSSYASLLSQLKDDRLSTRRLQQKLLITFQIQNNLLHYPNPPPPPTNRLQTPLSLSAPISKCP